MLLKERESDEVEEEEIELEGLVDLLVLPETENDRDFETVELAVVVALGEEELSLVTVEEGD